MRLTLLYKNVYMQPPVKIIHKYKNSNKYIRYRLYIFIGPNIPDNIFDVLKKIQNLSYKEAIKILTKEDHNMLNKYYNTNQWLKYFYINIISQKGGSNKEVDDNNLNEDFVN